jgi:hypothetical protein
MAQEIDTEDVIKRIVKDTGLSRAEINKRRDDFMAQFPSGDGGSLLTPVGALLMVSDKLGVKTDDPAPRAEPVLEAIMKDGAPELCQYCGSKKSWGIKVISKSSGKGMPGHITADGKPLVTIVDGKLRSSAATTETIRTGKTSKTTVKPIPKLLSLLSTTIPSLFLHS